MLFFSLGTMPGLLGVGVLGSFTQGNWRRWFVKTAAVAVVIVGVFSLSNGLVLAGVTGKASSGPNLGGTVDPTVKMENGVQVVDMRIDGYEYYPSRFTVVQGVPVDWVIDGSKAAGCAQVITSSKLGLTEYVPPNKGPRTIRFTPAETGFFPFSCTMGMTTPGAGFTVVSNDGGVKASASVQTAQGVASDSGSVGLQKCDPSVQDCSVQHVVMEVSKERGFYPAVIEVKNNMPVEMEFDTKVKLGGCMSTMVIPEYGVAHRLTMGKSTVSFTPTRTGTFPMTCSMGGLHAQIKVV
jgi:plastocyanin domain-containing protein